MNQPIKRPMAQPINQRGAQAQVDREQDAPLVSVAMTAYKSESTLARAIESVLAQSADFRFELIVGDDASPDQTIMIANDFAARYPGIVRVLAQPVNLGIMRNYYATFEACQGKYIAWLDADDYWTDPHKLAMQADILQTDPTVALVGHPVRWLSAEGAVTRERVPDLPAGRYGLDRILRNNFLPSPSVMFRGGLHRQLPEWYFSLTSMTDWPLYVLAACSGDIVLLDRIMADYTLNNSSSLWGKGDLFWFQLDADFYELVEGMLPNAYSRLVRSEKGNRYERLAYATRHRGDFVSSRKAALKAFTSPALTDNLNTKCRTLAASLLAELRWRLS